jgi:hypothetical protein
MSLVCLLELMIPPHYWLGSTVVVRPSGFGVVPGSIPGLAILFSSYTVCTALLIWIHCVGHWLRLDTSAYPWGQLMWPAAHSPHGHLICINILN